MIECYHLYFKQEDQLYRMNEQRTGRWHTVIAIGIGKVHANKNDGKFEGYIYSVIGSRSVPVDRLAGWQMK